MFGSSPIQYCAEESLPVREDRENEEKSISNVKTGKEEAYCRYSQVR